MFKEMAETHDIGYISIEQDMSRIVKGDLGIQISESGRVWICIDGQAFLRFTPVRRIDERTG